MSTALISDTSDATFEGGQLKASKVGAVSKAQLAAFINGQL